MSTAVPHECGVLLREALADGRLVIESAGNKSRQKVAKELCHQGLLDWVECVGSSGGSRYVRVIYKLTELGRKMTRCDRG